MFWQFFGDTPTIMVLDSVVDKLAYFLIDLLDVFPALHIFSTVTCIVFFEVN